MEKTDEINLIYKRSEMLDKVLTYLFWINSAIAFVSMKAGGKILGIVCILQIFGVLGYMIISIVDDMCCFYKSESARRKHALEKAFGVDITGLQTSGYYNNSMQPSLSKYMVNLFESVFFTKNIIATMYPMEIFKAVIAGAVFIVTLLQVQDKGVLLFLVQMIFSTEILTNVIGVFIYGHRVEGIYQKLYHAFITVGINDTPTFVSTLADVLEYEAVKAHYKIRLSSKKYNKLNKKLTEDWDVLEHKLKISIQESM